MSGAGSSDIDMDGYVHHLDEIERFCDQYGVWKHPTVITWRRRIDRCRRAIAKMHEALEHKHVGVLHVVYGYPDPMTRDFPKKVLDSFGELASLVKYTDIVEVKRQEMARKEALRMSTLPSFVSPTKDIPGHWRSHDDYVDEQSGDEITRVAIRQNLPVAHAPGLVDLMKHRDLYEYALRVITSSDALRAQLAPTAEKHHAESDDHYLNRHEGWLNKRDVFVAQANVDCDKMLVAASREYHRFWLMSG